MSHYELNITSQSRAYVHGYRTAPSHVVHRVVMTHSGPAFAPPTPTLIHRSPCIQRRVRVAICVSRASAGKDGEKPRDAISDFVARARSNRRPSARNVKMSGDATGNDDDNDGSLHRSGAASALDAVDRLFGAQDVPNERKDQHQEKKQPKPHIQREQWLNSVRSAKAPDDSDQPVDVSAVPPAPRRTARSRGRRRRRRTPAEESNAENTTSPPQANAESTRPRESNVKSSFARLIDIARRGGAPTSRSGRHRRPDFESMAEAMADVRNTGKKREAAPRKTENQSGVKSIKRIMNMTRLDAGNADEEDDDNDDITAPRGDEDHEPRQRYIATRRVGGRQRRILEVPAEWEPMSEEHIARLKSESAPLAPGRSIGADPVRDCSSCVGTGLETCAVCVGTGWVVPLRGEASHSQGRALAQVRAVWELPNLVIDREGSAQCPHCVGIGRSLCVRCEGSGSALRKGFDPADKYKVYDMFQGADGEYDDDDDDVSYNDIDFSDDNEPQNADEDDYFIYTGEASGFGLSLPSLESSAFEHGDTATVAPVADAEGADDSDYYIDALSGVYDEDMDDFRSKPNRRPLFGRVRSSTQNASSFSTVIDDVNQHEDEDDFDEDLETVAVLHNVGNDAHEDMQPADVLRHEDIAEHDVDVTDGSMDLADDDITRNGDDNKLDVAESSDALLEMDDGMVSATVVDDLEDDDEDNVEGDELEDVISVHDEDDVDEGDELEDISDDDVIEDELLSLDDDITDVDDDVDDEDDIGDGLPLYDEDDVDNLDGIVDETADFQ